MIDEIRSYFKTRIQEIDSDLKEHDQPFINDDIPTTNLDSSYAIQLGVITSTQQDQSALDIMKVNVQIKEHGYNCTTEKYDELYCKAQEIRLNICNKENVLRGNDYIENIELLSLTPSPIPDNNNGFIFDLEFDVTLSFNL